MELAALFTLVSPIIGTVSKYLKNKLLKRIEDKALETIEEKTGDAVSELGSRAFAILRAWFQKKNDHKAQQALSLAEEDPLDDDYRDKLIKETARVAAADSEFLNELKKIASEVKGITSDVIVQNIDNKAPNQGAQGVFNAPVNIGQNPKDDRSKSS